MLQGQKQQEKITISQGLKQTNKDQNKKWEILQGQILEKL